jgi:uncharacterized protein YggE
MSRLLAVAACVVLMSSVAGVASAQGGRMMMEHPRTITVSGTGNVAGEPDKARVQLTVQKSNPSMGKARSDALAVVEKFLALTRKLGIDPKKVRTTSAFVNPEYRWDQTTNQQILTGYMVQRQLEVEVTDLDKLGPLIEGAVDAGVNNVSPPQLDSSKRRDLNRQALAAAAKDAEANARAIADTLGVKLGSLQQLTAGDANPPPMPVPMPMMMAKAAMAEGADAGGGASYTPGSLEFEARVNATFDVAP